MEDVKCLFCNIQNDEIFWEENGYRGRKCQKCNLIYISPRPTESEMRALYEKDKGGSSAARGHFRYSYFKELNARYTLNRILRYKAAGSILELGSGGGQFLEVAKNRSFIPYAVEINKELADYLSDQLNFRTENCSASNPDYFGSQKFDVIYHKDLLSHLHFPKEAFKNLNQKLKDDGILVFETGNFGDLSKGWIRFIGILNYPEHVYLFSDRNVKELLKSSGFELIKSYYHSMALFFFVKKVVNGLKRLFEFVRYNKIITDRKSPDEQVISRRNLTFYQKNIGFLMHCILYRLSKGFPHCWPSTIIYIARKSKN